MNNFGTHTWPNVFLPDLRDRLVRSVPDLTADRVFRSNYSEDDHLRWPPTDRFVTFFMPDFPADQPGVSGGGLFTTPFDATLDVTVFVRLEADIENRSTRAMEDDANGTDVFLRQILSALQMYPGLLDEATGLYSFRRPMRVRRVTVRPRSGRDDSRWTVARMSFEVSFVADLGVPYP